jgi:signal transduction histidine kinase
VLVRLASSSRAQRLLVAPVVGPGCVGVALVAVDAAHSWRRGFLSNDPVDRRLWLLEALALLLVVAGVIWQRIAARRFRGAVARVVVELADSARPGALRDALATTLGDPDLELFHADDGGWIDGKGRARPIDEPGSQRAATELIRDGRVVAALVHRRGLLDDPARVSELERTAGLALEHERLHAKLQAQLVALRASRAQIVAVGDAERRRLERDLHDGAQQALAGLAMSLGLARASATDLARAERMGAAQDPVRAALAELRAMAHRISPAALQDAGLAAALDVLAEWAPQVEIAHVPVERFDASVESAAYFAVAAIASTVSGRIVIDAHHTDGTLIVDVGLTERPGELLEIEDRIAALDGRLLVDNVADGGVVVRVALPCES